MATSLQTSFPARCETRTGVSAANGTLHVKAMQASLILPPLRKGLEQFVIQKDKKLSISSSLVSRSGWEKPIPILTTNRKNKLMNEFRGCLFNLRVGSMEKIMGLGS